MLKVNGRGQSRNGRVKLELPVLADNATRQREVNVDSR